jgi:arabinose-5-phosphate isomerase
VQRENEILGIITDGDIRRAMEARQAKFFDIRPMDIATREPKCIGPDSKLIEAERQMTQYKVNSLLVVDNTDQLIGVIQIYDIKL